MHRPRSGPPRPPGQFQRPLELDLSGCCAVGALSTLFLGILLSPCIRVVGVDEGPGGPLRGRPSPRHGRVDAPDARQAVGRELGRLVRGRDVPLPRRRDLAAILASPGAADAPSPSSPPPSSFRGPPSNSRDAGDSSGGSRRRPPPPRRSSGPRATMRPAAAPRGPDAAPSRRDARRRHPTVLRRG